MLEFSFDRLINKHSVSMKILLVDDHTSFCEGLIAAISAKRPEIEVNFESRSELVPTSLLGNNQYDLIIVDVMMPGLGGVELVKHLNAMGNYIPVLIMSSVEDIDTIQELYSLGILGFIPKYYSVASIVEVVEKCSDGEMHIPEEWKFQITLPQQVKASSGQDRAKIESAISEINSENRLTLTKRQVEILSLMDQGLSNQQMAEVLHISVATIKTHIYKLYGIFEVNNRVNCLRAAKQAKLR